MIVPLSGIPDRTYGNEELRSKYINDDGGPSLWWRDGRIKELQERLAGVAVVDSVQEEIVATVRYQSTTVIRRLTSYVGRRKKAEHAAEVLDSFSRRESAVRLFDIVVLGLPAFLAAAALGECLNTGQGFGATSLVLVILMLVSLVPALICYERREDGYLGPKELNELRNRPDEPS
jgi:hypothetical protein